MEHHTSVHSYPQNAQVFPRETVDNYNPLSCPLKPHDSGFFYESPMLFLKILVDNFVYKQLYIDFLLTFIHKMLYNSTRSGTELQTLTKTRRRAGKGE